MVIGELYFDTRESHCECACNVSFIFEHIALKYCFSAIFSKKVYQSFMPIYPDISADCIFSSKPEYNLFFSECIFLFFLHLLDAICIAEEKKFCTSCNHQTVYIYTLSSTVSFELMFVRSFE